MATKTISIKTEAWEALRSARRFPTESFSTVILRARWQESAIAAADLARRVRAQGASLSGLELDAIERAKLEAPPAESKWTSA